MSVTLEQRISAINSKTELLMKRYKVIERQRNESLEQLEVLQQSMAALKAENERLKREVDYFRISSTFSPEKADFEQSRKFLSDLVWEIDKCIKQLSE